MSCCDFKSYETMRRIRLRNRFIYLFVCCLFITSFFAFMTNTQRPAIKTLVTETQKQLSNLKENFREEKKLKVDKVFLHFLGLTEEPTKSKEDKDISSESGSSASLNVPWHTLANVSGPVIVSAVQNGQLSMAMHFLRNIFTIRPESSVILFDMGLSRVDLQDLLIYCNGSVSEGLESNPSTNQTLVRKILNRRTIMMTHSSEKYLPPLFGKCHIAPFDSFDLFPSHVRTRAYRPILIQQVLRHVNCCIFWLELNQRLTSNNLQELLNKTRSNGGVSVWLRENTMPTSSLTHPKMLEYLVAPSKIEDYNFQHMVSMNGLILFATPEVVKNLMLPWVQCSLLEECIEPIGAQATGCRFDKKPQFRYSGCHSYDISALNIILGKMFDFDESRYISETSVFIQAVDNEDEIEESKSNETVISYDENNQEKMYTVKK